MTNRISIELTEAQYNELLAALEDRLDNLYGLDTQPKQAIAYTTRLQKTLLAKAKTL